MRELERRRPAAPSPRCSAPRSVALVGAGRLGTTIAAGLRAAEIEVVGPLRRDESPAAIGAGVDAVLLCVPDRSIAAAAAGIADGPLLGHCSGATGLEVLGARPGFSLHPLMTIPLAGAPGRLRGAAAAIDGTDAEALACAASIAETLGLRPLQIAAEDRTAYHAAASIASNFLVTLEAFAGAIGASAGLPREALVPLVEATVENWARGGPEAALTGPVARGDDGTVAAQRAAVAARTPEMLALFDALVAATRELADPPVTERDPLPC